MNAVLTPEQARLAETHLPLVRAIAHGMVSLWPIHVRVDDLVAAGSLGLVQAILSYNPAYGTPFDCWARRRIKGAILDYARAADWAPRSVRHFARVYGASKDGLRDAWGREPTSAEVAADLGLTSGELEDRRARFYRSKLLSLDHEIEGVGRDDDLTYCDLIADPAHGPGEEFESAELAGYLRTAIAVLPDRLRYVITEVSYEGRPRIDVADELGVTESRICQMIGEAVALIRSGIEAQYQPGEFGDPAPSVYRHLLVRQCGAYAEAITDTHRRRTRTAA